MNHENCRVYFLTLVVLRLVLFAPPLARGAETQATPDSEWERTVKAAEQEGQVVVYKIAMIPSGRRSRKNIRESK